MAFFGSVEIKPAVLFAIPVIERDAVRITVIADHGKHAARLLLQNADALFIAYLLLETPHWSEHISAPFRA
jgi:hypothetical protein